MSETGTAAGWLAHTLAGGGLLLLLASLGAACVRQPARRLRLAEWAVAAALLLAVLSLGPAWLVVTEPLPPAPAGAATETPESSAAAPAAPSRESPAPFVLVEPPAVEPGRADPSPSEDSPPFDRPAAASPGARAGRPPLPEGTAGGTPALPAPADRADASAAWGWDRLAAVAAGAYLGGAALLAGRWLLGWLALRRLLRGAAPVTGRAAALLADLAGGRPPRLLASPRVRAPFSCGPLRPTVVLPAGLCESASDAALRWVLAHEMAHLRRRDAWGGLLFALGQAVYFALPWFWWLRRQARLCQEYLADAAAVAAGGPPEEYAHFLLSWAAAPPPPAGACGVRPRPSDLFRRIQMLLKIRSPLERRCPRRWSLAAAPALLALAVLAAGVNFQAAAAAPAPPEPKKEEPKKDEPKKDDAAKEEPKKAEPAPADEDLPGVPSLEEMLKRMPAGFDPEQVKEIRARMLKMQREMRKQLEQARPANPANPFGPGFGSDLFRPGAAQGVRLGALVEKPNAALADQLDLPKDQGVVLSEITPDSAAAKAGLKAHDVLLELNGKPVPSDPAAFAKQLDEIKPDVKVDAVVLRKGKKETVKDLTLPEAKAADPNIGGFPPGGNFLQPPALPAPPNGFPGGGIGFPGGGLGLGNANNVMTTTFRTNDRFTTRRQEGSLVITVTGKAADGKATVTDISVQDGGESNKYESVDKAPEKYRDKIKDLIEMTEKSNAKIEIKGP
jgi:hypothetical protein